MDRKLETYVLLKILKYCTGSSARSYQCKYALKGAFKNKNLESVEELGAAIKEIIHHSTIRGKFSSVHPDLAAEGITRVEVGEEGLHFITSNEPGELSDKTDIKILLSYKSFQRRQIRRHPLKWQPQMGWLLSLSPLRRNC